MIKQARIAMPVTALALLLAGASAPQALASGFQLREQSASAQGTAFAGVAAGGSDISNMFFNPAVLTGFDGFQFVLGGSLVAPKAELVNAKGTRAAIYGGSTINGPAATANSAKSAVLPEIYAMWSVTKDFKLGFSVNAPFGMVTEYDQSFPGRYHALKSDLKVVDLSFTAAYKLHPTLSIGASIVSRKVEATLTSAVDFGQMAFLGMNQAAANPLASAAARTQYLALAAAFSPNVPANALAPFDGKATIEGTKNVVGYKAGLVYQPCATFRAGLSYQSGSVVKVDGTVKYELPTIANPSLAGALAQVATGAKLVNGTAAAEVNLPSTTSLGLSWDVTPAVNVAFEADRTGWKTFEELRFKFGSGQTDSVTNENWRNTMFYSLGATWKTTQALTLRAGLGTDQGAVATEFRTPRIPDADRTWMSVGMGYTINKNLGVDFAYTHIAVKDGAVDLKTGSTTASPDFFRGNLTGTFQNSINIVALHARITF